MFAKVTRKTPCIMKIQFLLFGLMLATSAQAGIPSVDLEGLQDRIGLKSDTTYVVNFWATWCAPCVKELPYFEELNEKHPDGKVKVLLVSLDADDNKEKRLIPFVEGRDIRSEVLHFNESRSPNYWIPEISKQWRGSIPATLFINGSTGNSLFLEKSFHSLEEIEEVILRLK